MICIFSTAIDFSTTDVMRWLHYLGRKDVIRVNMQDANAPETVKLDLSQDSFSFQLKEKRVHLQDIEAVWYRKGRHWLCDQFFPVSVEDHARFSAYLQSKLQAEEATLSAYLHHLVEATVPVLGQANGSLNKLLVLQAAREAGLLVPAFAVTNYLEGMRKAFRQFPDRITKALSDGLYFFDETEARSNYLSYTEKLGDELAASLDQGLSPSLIQENIHKQYEVRVFFLKGKCYSMAILSQSDEKTKTDFRKYNEEKPNRFVPYQLPAEIGQKIRRLFQKLKLNTGSVDLMVDQQDQFYFLEINPVGQFSMVSTPCNYYLEKKVALTLIDHASKSPNY